MPVHGRRASARVHYANWLDVTKRLSWPDMALFSRLRAYGTSKRTARRASAAYATPKQTNSGKGRSATRKVVPPRQGTPKVQGKGNSDTNKRAQKLATAANRKVKLASLDFEVPTEELRRYSKVAADLCQAYRSSSKKASRGRGAKKSLQHALLQAHKQCFQAALKAEISDEWSTAEDRLNNWSPDRLKEEGLALFGLQAERAGLLLRDTIFRLAMPVGGTPLPFHNFAHGDMVLLSGPGNISCVVMDVAKRWIRVAIPEAAASGMPSGPWRLDLYINSTAHDRCMAALDDFSSAQKSDSSGSQALCKALLGADEKELLAVAASPPPWAPSKKGAKATLDNGQVEGLNPALNASQSAAVNEALGRTLTLWQGPPGTGKTKTLLQFIVQAAAFLGRGQILASAASNVAVDNIVAGLRALNIDVVRLGQPVKVLPELRASTLEQRLLEHPAGQIAAALRDKAAKLPASAARLVREEALELEERATEEILKAAQVVAATCIGAGDERLSCCQFKLCALDEATQATEPASLVPLLRSCEAAVLVGDQCQLPPTVVSQQAEQGGLALSLFERLQLAGLPPMVLDVQYRMHPAIAEAPSQLFYGGKVKSNPTSATRPAPKGFAWPNSAMPLAFVDCKGEEMRTSSGEDIGASYLNTGQAELVLRIAQQLLQEGDLKGRNDDIAVVTPYNGQVRELHRLISKLPQTARMALQEVEIRSVDGFQGREKEAIIFSTVRSNARGSVGFLRDARRLNVALTRAKRGLIVVGNQATLQQESTWSAWLKWMLAHHLVVGAGSHSPQLFNGASLSN